MKSLIATLVLVLSSALALSAQQSNQPTKKHSNGLPQDWSHRYVTYSAGLATRSTSNPRALSSWLQHIGRQTPLASISGTGNTKKNKKNVPTKRVDWNVSLGSSSANLAPFSYPAKFSFDINAIPSCSDDFVAYGLDTPGSTTQATLIGFNNLYSSGVVNGGGMCDVANSGLPTTLFAFDTTTSAGSSIKGSLALSLDGAKIAFAETYALSVGSAFHVLRWGAGGGSASSPIQPDPQCNTSCLYTVPLGTSYTQSPYIDYGTDSAYVVDADGKLWKVNHVFNGVPKLATDDPAWPDSGACQTVVGSSGVNSAFFVNGRVYFTERQQVLHIVTPGKVCADTVVTLGPQGTIADNPIFSVMDDTHGYVFLFANNNDGNTAVYQADLDGNVLQTVFVAGGGAAPSSGTFDNNYWSDPNASSGFLYFNSTEAAQSTLRRIAFNQSPVMNGFADGLAGEISSQPGVKISSVMEIYNPSNTANPDSIVLQGSLHCGSAAQSAGCIRSYGVADTSISAVASVDEAQQATYAGGMVVDNIADPNSFSQASSIYFAVQGKAVKLTQVGLQ
jgi:hypothetical protein